jgi:predicted secreted protein
VAENSNYEGWIVRSNTMSEIIEAGEDQNGQQIEMNLQQTLRVTLPEVRAAGFRWSLRTSSGRIQSPVGDELDATTGATVGVAQHHWDFRAKQVGATELVFEYVRPWARTAAAARTFSVSFRVADNSKDAAHQSA